MVNRISAMQIMAPINLNAISVFGRRQKSATDMASVLLLLVLAMFSTESDAANMVMVDDNVDADIFTGRLYFEDSHF